MGMQSSNNRFFTSAILTHIGVWLAIILIPLLVQWRNDEINVRYMSHVWLMLFGLAVTFYANYSFAIDRFLYKKRYLYFILFNIILFIAVRYIDGWINCAVDWVLNIPPRPRTQRSLAIKSLFIYNDIINFALGVGASLGLRYISHVNEINKDRERLEHEKLETEVNLLKYQLQPHFFFNTLNNIYSLIGQSPNNAQKAVHSLSKMMRYVLYDNTAELISLSSELDFISNFVSLKRLSLGSNVHTEFNIPSETHGFTLPPLLLIPLVENAFKHGIVPGAESSITCDITVSHEQLNLEIKNTINNTEGNEDRSHSGIGLQNLHRLLDLQYGSSYSLSTFVDPVANTYTAKLSLPNLSK